MKRNKSLLIIATLSLLVVSAVVVFRPSSNFKQELRDFAVKDTASITKIFLSDRSGNSVTLTKDKDSRWLVNDSFPPQRDMLNRLMRVIYSVEVKARVAKSAYNTIIKDLSASSTKCEIYLDGHDDPDKVYYVGGHTADALGTFMILDDSNMPFIMELPGFNGYLTPWYPTKPGDWRNMVVFDYSPGQISAIRIDYPAYPSYSFMLHTEDKGATIQPTGYGSTAVPLDSTVLNNYLVHFKSLPFEGDAQSLKSNQRDSILQETPLAVLQVTDRHGSVRKLLLYPMPLNEYAVVKEDSLGRPLKFDLDRMYGYLSPPGNWMVLQHYSFDPVLRRFADFTTAGKAVRTAAGN